MSLLTRWLREGGIDIHVRLNHWEMFRNPPSPWHIIDSSCDLCLWLFNNINLTSNGLNVGFYKIFSRTINNQIKQKSTVYYYVGRHNIIANKRQRNNAVIFFPNLKYDYYTSEKDKRRRKINLYQFWSRNNRTIVRDFFLKKYILFIIITPWNT